MRKEVAVAGTVAAAERSEGHRKGGPGPPRNFFKSRLQMLQSELFCGLFCPCDIILEINIFRVLDFRFTIKNTKIFIQYG